MLVVNSSMRSAILPPVAFAVLILAAVFTFPACSTFRHAEASRPSEVAQTEAFLKQAGFGQLEVETPEQLETARSLPTYELRHYPAQDGDVYWYYDPGECQCVMVGDEKAYEQYQGLTQQKNDIAEYEAQSQQEEAASLNLLSPTFFPTPIFFVAGGALAYGGGGGRVPIGGVPGGGHHHGGGGGGMGGGFGGGGHFGGGHSGGGHSGGGHR